MLQQARQKIRESSGETVRAPSIQQGIVSRAPQKAIIENRPSIETTDDNDDEDEEFFYEDDEQIDAKDEEEIKMTPKPKDENKPVILTSNFFLPGKPIPKLEQHHEFENHEPNDLTSGDISETNGQQKDNAEDVIDSLPEEETERIVEKTTKKFLAPIATTTTTTTTTTTPRTTTTTTTTAKTTKATSATSPKPVTLDPNVEYEYYDEYVDEPTTTQTKTISKPAIEHEEQTTIHVPVQEAEVEEEEDGEVEEDESEPIEEHSTIENIDEPEVTAKTVEKSVKFSTSNEPIETNVEPIETSSASSTEAIENPSTSTEGYVVVASVQTSRSISGARYLTFPQVEQEEKRQSLSDTQKDVKKLHKDDDYSNENVPDDDDSSDSNKADDLVKSTEDKSKKTQPTKDEATSGEIAEAAPSNDSTEQTSEENVAQSKNESDTPNVDVVKSRTHKLSSISEKLAHLHELNEPKPEITTKSVPVVIRKFTPRTTTKAPARKLPSITSKKPHFDVDDELASLLPPGFKYRAQSTTPKAETTTTTEKIDVLQKIQFKEISLEGLLPKDYKPPPKSESEPKTVENVTKIEPSDILSKIKFDDNIEALLPKDYKPPLPSSSSQPPSTTKAPFRLSTVTEDISKFLPPGFKLPKESSVTTTTPASSTTNRPQLKTTMDDISKFLPPGYRLPKSTTTTEKPETTTSNNAGNSDEQQSLLNKLSFNADISSLLPPGFKANASEDESASKEKTDEMPSSSTPSSSGAGNSGFKLVFPKGIGKRPGVRLTTPRPSYAEGPTPPGITIRKGLPTR